MALSNIATEDRKFRNMVFASIFGQAVWRDRVARYSKVIFECTGIAVIFMWRPGGGGGGGSLLYLIHLKLSENHFGWWDLGVVAWALIGGGRGLFCWLWGM